MIRHSYCDTQYSTEQLW